MTARKTHGTNSNDLAKLRDQAARLIEKADQIERDLFVKIGKLTMHYYPSGFEDMTQFKKELESLAKELS